MLGPCLKFPRIYDFHDFDTDSEFKTQFTHKNVNLPQQQNLSKFKNKLVLIDYFDCNEILHD